MTAVTKTGGAAPAVSVIMATHNDERFLDEAIRSILDQSMSDFEFLILNDGSTDGTESILGILSDPRVRLDRATTPIGLTKALDSLVAAAKGRYIARMDGDDISDRGRFAAQVAFLDANPDHAAVGLTACTIDEQGRRIEKPWRPLTHDEIMTYLLHDNPFVHSSLMLRASMLREVGGYDTRWEFAQDYDLLLRLSLIGKLAMIDDPPHYWRSSGSSITSAKRADQISARDGIRRKFLAENPPRCPDEMNRLFANLLNYPDDAFLGEMWRRAADPAVRMPIALRCMASRPVKALKYAWRMIAGR